jgi:hypothetical protein
MGSSALWLPRHNNRLSPPIASVVNPSHPLSRDLNALWLLNEYSDYRYDASGHGYTLTPTNNVDFQGGPFGAAAHFVAASNTYLERYPAETDLQNWNGPLFTAAWVSLDTISAADHHIVTMYENAVATNQLILRETVNGGVSHFEFQYCGGIARSDDTYTLALNTWYLVMGWYDPTATGVECNVQVGGFPTIWTGAKSSTPSPNANAGMDIGCLWDNQYVMNGRIGPVYYYHRVLNDAERQQLYNEPFAMFNNTRNYWIMSTSTGPSTFTRNTISTSSLEKLPAIPESDITLGLWTPTPLYTTLVDE